MVQLRSTRHSTASGRPRGSGISARKTAAGRCVKTMVRTRPMRRARGAAARIDSVEMSAVRESRAPSAEGCIPCAVLKKYAIHDAGTRPEAKASMANRPERRSTSGREEALTEGRRGREGVLGATAGSRALVSPDSACEGGDGGRGGGFARAALASQAGLSSSGRRTLRKPRPAYAPNRARPAPVGVQSSRCCSACAAHPHASVPSVVPALPLSVYQVKMSLRRAGGVRWARVDSSTARKGPISAPLWRGEEVLAYVDRKCRGTTMEKGGGGGGGWGGDYGPGAHDAQHTRGHQRPVAAAEREHGPAGAHQRGREHEGRAAAEAVGEDGQAGRAGDVAEQGEGHEEPDAGVGDAEAGEVQHEDQGRQPESGEAHEALQAEQLGVAGGAVDGSEAELGAEAREEGRAVGGGHGGEEVWDGGFLAIPEVVEREEGS